MTLIGKSLSDEVRAEAFFFPHCLAFAATYTLCDKMTLDESVRRLMEIRHDKVFTLTGLSNRPQQLTLNQLADTVLDTLRTTAFGPGSDPGTMSLVPISVVTFINVEGVDPATPTIENGEVHKALEALTQWSKTYSLNPLTPFDKSRKPTPKSPSSHVLYATKRGCAVWFPALFTIKDGKTRTLSCYHRNLVLALLQAESLGLFVSDTAKRLAEREPVLGVYRNCAQYAAGLLGDMYRGHDEEGRKSTYRSQCLPTLIENSQLKAPLNAVRNFFGKSAV